MVDPCLPDFNGNLHENVKSLFHPVRHRPTRTIQFSSFPAAKKAQYGAANPAHAKPRTSPVEPHGHDVVIPEKIVLLDKAPNPRLVPGLEISVEPGTDVADIFVGLEVVVRPPVPRLPDLTRNRLHCSYRAFDRDIRLHSLGSRRDEFLESS